MSDFDPYRPPTSALVTDDMQTLIHAGRGTRLAAKFLDGIIGFGSIGIISAIAIPALLVNKRNGGSNVGLVIFLSILGIVAIGILVWNMVWLSMYGQTVGKRICKIKIVRTDGSPVSLGRVIGLRWLPVTVFGVVPVIGPFASLVNILLIFRDSHQCLHDQIADTIVVEA